MDLRLDWSADKNAQLIERYGISFSDLEMALEHGALILDREHPNTDDYAHQRQLLVLLESYVWVIPYVLKEDGSLFLKTAFPSRVATRKFLDENEDRS